jgi:uncharacterized protein
MEKPVFTWSQLGNIVDGRPNLGLSTSVEVYRMLQYSMKAALEDEWDEQTAKRLMHKSGKLAGCAFADEYLDKNESFNKFLASVQAKLENLSIGILKMEKSDINNLRFVVTVSEDLDCSGLPVTGATVCDFDEGFLEGVFEFYTGKVFRAVEIDCWSTGERICRFTVESNPSE